MEKKEKHETLENKGDQGANDLGVCEGRSNLGTSVLNFAVITVFAD